MPSPSWSVSPRSGGEGLVAALLDHSVAAPAAGPAAEDRQRGEQSDGAHDHEDHTDGVEIDPAGVLVHVQCECDHRADGYEKDADADAHAALVPRACYSNRDPRSVRHILWSGRDVRWQRIK